MIGNAFRISSLTAIFTVFALHVAHGSVQAAGSSASADDDQDDASPLTAIADFNRDGIPDFAKVVVSNGAGVLTVSLGRVDGIYQEVESDVEVGPAPRAMVAADFNQDGVPDVIVGDEDGSLRLFTGDSKGGLIAAGDVAHVDSVVSIAVADFNRDGIPDIAVSDWRRSLVAVFLGNGKGTFEGGWPFSLRMPGKMPHISAADFNGDGIPDLAVVYGDDGEYTFDVFVGNGKGAFAIAPNLSFAKDPNAHCAT